MTTKNKTIIKAEPGKQELFITREFEAPRELVFRAYTDEKIYAQWLGPNNLETWFDVFEPVSGGKYKFTQKDKDGNQYSFHGVTHEVVPNERIIGTFEFDGLPETGHVTLETTRFEALPGNRTRVTSQSIFQSVSDRDGMIASGMEHGVVEGYERLDDILETLKK
jgi:uncharacterized protein YndB with AHSA1/START domain